MKSIRTVSVNTDRIISENKKLNAIIDNALDAILIVDELGFIKDWNQKANLLFEYKDRELYNLPFLDLLNEREDNIKNFFHNVRMNISCTRVKLFGLTSSKKSIPICFSYKSTYHNNEKSFIVYIRDLSILQQREREIIKAKQKAEQERKSEREFLAHMSHEIRTPMNAVMGIIHLLKHTELSNEQKDLMKTLEFSSKNVLDLISDILDFSKIEEGKLELDHQVFDLKTMLSNLYESFRINQLNDTLSIDLHLDEQIPDQLIGDKSRLSQILTNLIGNALKFTTQGYVSIQARTLQIQQKSCLVEIKVSDTGIGIAKDKIQTIFKRYEQENADTYSRFGGTGLGLVIVKELVELMEGQINVESKKGTGTTFTIQIPFYTTEKQQTKQVVKETNTIDFSGKHIIVAEDNPINQHLMKSLLERWKCKADIVEDGQELIGRIQQKKYDLIFMDINMPRMNGYQTTQWMKENEKEHFNNDTPIIALTASAFTKERERILQLGADDFISKPFDPNDISNKMSEYFSSNEQNQEESIVDLSQLHKIANNNESFVEEMIDIFITNTPEQLDKLVHLLKNQNWTGLKIAVHTLKSSLHLIGMTTQYQKLHQIEIMIGEDRIDLDVFTMYIQETIIMVKKAIIELSSRK